MIIPFFQFFFGLGLGRLHVYDKWSKCWNPILKYNLIALKNFPFMIDKELTCWVHGSLRASVSDRSFNKYSWGSSSVCLSCDPSSVSMASFSFSPPVFSTLDIFLTPSRSKFTSPELSKRMEGDNSCRRHRAFSISTMCSVTSTSGTSVLKQNTYSSHWTCLANLSPSILRNSLKEK